ncbi:MAG: hypothetical protein JNM99_17955 [Verrucomicrobiaceae bacterium]|nr:hypothetical protein [Verrucomicrobiaceae bacterium]
MSRYRRFYKRSYGHHRASQHISERHALSCSLGGIDRDVEQIFLNLPDQRLEMVFLRYGREHGMSALSYARKTYSQWKSGAVKMSGSVAERLLNLVPPVLDVSVRFELVKKLRNAHMHKEHRYVTCEPQDWRMQVAPVIADLLTASDKFQLPEHAVSRVRWLAEGDAAAAQRLLAAAEQEEAAVRIRFLDAEFRRIDYLLANIKATKHVSHVIELPQGRINVAITLPRKGFWGWLSNLLS